MKIGIDARVCDEGWYYGAFVCELIESFCEMQKDHEITIYRSKKALISGKITELPNAKQVNLKYNRHNIFDDIPTKKLFNSEKFGYMLFFDSQIPGGITSDIYVIIQDLKEIFFPKKKWLQRKVYTSKLHRAIHKSKKVMVLDAGTALELNERMNVREDVIERIPGFFPHITELATPKIEINIKSKHNLRGDYLIYDSGNEVHNNFERILKSIVGLKKQWIILYLIILCDETIKDIDIREFSLREWISDQILFLWAVENDIESSYYNQSSGVIFSSIYESFPFSFVKALHYNTPIFANEIPAHLQTMGEHIHFLDPLSTHNMIDTLKAWLWNKKQSDYTEIWSNWNRKNSANRLSEITTLENSLNISL